MNTFGDTGNISFKKEVITSVWPKEIFSLQEGTSIITDTVEAKIIISTRIRER